MFTRKNSQLLAIFALALTMVFTSCKKNDVAIQSTGQDDETTLKTLISENGTNPDELDLQNTSLLNAEGYVYSESNETGMNKIYRYRVQSNGALLPLASVTSGGAGTGMGLGSQGALILDASHEWLYAVNAGDNSISSFSVASDGKLTLAHTTSSGGMTPISLTCHGQYLYVVNSTSSNICGFMLSAGGMMTKINDSEQSLSANPAGPAQITFQPEGKVLYVTEKATNKIAIFHLNNDGKAGPGTFMNSVGETPFGFAFTQTENFMIVSNAAGGAAGMGSATSYATDMLGNTSDVNGAVGNKQAAPCWVAVTKSGRFAYVTNTASNNISAYYVSPVGALHYIFFSNSSSGEAPTDIVVSGNNMNVYVINSASHSVGEYRRDAFGQLNYIGQVAGIPASQVGLTAY